MEYRNRAERRRAKKQGEKVSKPPVYNYTPGSLRNQLDWEAKAEVRDQLKKVREEATADAINTAMMLLLTLPCNIILRELSVVKRDFMRVSTRWIVLGIIIRLRAFSMR